MPGQGLHLRGRPRCWQWTLSPATFPLPGARMGQAMGLWSCDEKQSPTEWPWGWFLGCSGLSLLPASGP